MAGRTLEHAILDHILEHERLGVNKQIRIDYDKSKGDVLVYCGSRMMSINPRVCEQVEVLDVRRKLNVRRNRFLPPKKGRASKGVN